MKRRYTIPILVLVLLATLAGGTAAQKAAPTNGSFHWDVTTEGESPSGCSTYRTDFVDYMMDNITQSPGFGDQKAYGVPTQCGAAEIVYYPNFNLPQDFNLRVKPNRNLAICVDDVTVANGSTHNIGTNPGGDADNDNVITISDFNIFSATFGKSYGDPGFDARGDFDYDGTVSIIDYNIMYGNFGESGCARLW